MNLSFKNFVVILVLFWIIMIANSLYCTPSAEAAVEFDLGVEIGQGISNEHGMFTWTESRLEINGDPQPPFDLLPWLTEDILLLDEDGREIYHSLETFFDVGTDTDSYTFGAWILRDEKKSKDFNGFGVNWFVPLIWKEVDDEGTVTKHKTIRLGVYSNGDNDWMAKLQGKYPLYKGENYMLKFNVTYDNKDVEVIKGVIDHPWGPGSKNHIQAGYWYGMWGVMMTRQI